MTLATFARSGAGRAVAAWSPCIALLVRALASEGDVEAEPLLAECSRPPLEHPLAEANLRLATVLRQSRNHEAARLLKVQVPIIRACATAWSPPWKRPRGTLRLRTGNGTRVSFRLPLSAE